MHLGIVNHTFACSTLILGDFSDSPYIDGHPDWLSVEAERTPMLRFKQRWDSAVIYAEDENSKSLSSRGQQALEGYSMRDFAFITASTDQFHGAYEEIFRRLGMKETTRVKKKKNPSNRCIFWMMELKPFLKALDTAVQEDREAIEKGLTPGNH